MTRVVECQWAGRLREKEVKVDTLALARVTFTDGFWGPGGEREAREGKVGEGTRGWIRKSRNPEKGKGV